LSPKLPIVTESAAVDTIPVQPIGSLGAIPGQPTSSLGAIIAPAAPATDVRTGRPLADILHRHGYCCGTDPGYPGCSSLVDECRFIFGSCRTFFGESCPRQSNPWRPFQRKANRDGNGNCDCGH